tara:strand:+ start:413 stop:1486 length:1074 start_codon:yes stop_codon:yes gene_type:complete
MKLAVILFGQSRFFDITWPLIKQEFTFENVEVDFFVHFWHNTGYTPLGTEEPMDTSIRHILNSKEFKKVKTTNYEKLDKMCDDIKHFYDNIICRDNPLQNSRENLRYTFGQHFSIKTAYNLIKDYEKTNNIKYDLIVKTRSDIIYRISECYETEEEYNKTKYNYYFNNDNLHSNFVKCNALRFLNLNKKAYDSTKEVYTKQIFSFYNEKYREFQDKDWWEPYIEEYYVRLCHNDWTLIASREAADVYFGRWFENFHYSLAKDLLQNKNKMKKCITNSEHSMQGQILLNNDIQAVCFQKRRDVRLLNKKEIKEHVEITGKILVTPWQTTTNKLKYDLVKRWSTDKKRGQARALQMPQI